MAHGMALDTARDELLARHYCVGVVPGPDDGLGKDRKRVDVVAHYLSLSVARSAKSVNDAAEMKRLDF